MASKTANVKQRPRKRWLMLTFQLPAKPAYQRVKLWRKLQAVGAVSLKHSVYVLPSTDNAKSSFLQLLRDVDLGHGEGVIYESELVAGMRDDQLRALFNAARDSDYDALAQDMRRLLQAVRRKKGTPESAPAMVQLRQRLEAIEQVDFFGASGRQTAEGLLSQLDHSLIYRDPVTRVSALGPADLTGRVWVTRQDIHVDRIACAWLIKRFIDPKGTLKFVNGKSYSPGPREFRYDMKDGEFTHEGDNCSFETLLRLDCLADPALKSIGEIIHDMDLKDGKFGHPETPGIAHVISGICRTQGTDEARVARGQELFDHIYEQFRRRKE